MALHSTLRPVALALLPALLLAGAGPGWARFLCRSAQAIVASPCCDEGRDLSPDSVERSTCCVSAGGELLLDESKPVAPSPEPLPPSLFVGMSHGPPAASRLTAAARTPLPAPTGPPILQRTRALLI